nr:hypothetical protein [Tanacetum cinerariifolium]
MKESEVQAIKEIEKRVKEREIQQQESLSTDGQALDASLVNKGITLEANLSTNDIILEACLVDEGTLMNSCLIPKGLALEACFVTKGIEMDDSLQCMDDADINIEPSHDSNIASENNSNIISDTSNMDSDRDKEEHDYVAYEHQRQTNQTFRMLLPKEDNVNTRKQGLGFENQNDDVIPNLLNKAKELAHCLYNIDEMGKDLLSDHTIIFDEELKCEAEKHLKVKQRKSMLLYHGFVYGETQFNEPPKVPLKRIDVNLKKHLEQAQLKKDQERTNEMVKMIDNLLLERRIMQSLECHVGGRINNTDYVCGQSDFVVLIPSKIKECVDHRPKLEPTYRYSFKAFVSDETSTMLLAFLNPIANAIAHHKCSKLVCNLGIPNPQQILLDILAIKGTPLSIEPAKFEDAFKPVVRGETRTMYSFKAFISDETSTMLLAFFNLIANAIAHHECSKRVCNLGIPNPQQIPLEILAIEGTPLSMEPAKFKDAFKPVVRGETRTSMYYVT